MTVLNISAQAHESETIFHYADYVVEIAMGFIGKNIARDNLLHPILNQLNQYDQEHETGYLNTLKHYVQSFFNKNATARMLAIHRNTLFYRLERISEITGVDIRNPKTANHLLLSFCYLDALSGEEQRYHL